MRLVIVTGMSGAGKTTALKVLEDAGYYCVDNLPVVLLEKFAELVYDGGEDRKNAALGIDIRSGEELPLLASIIKEWRVRGYVFSILFLEASDETLIKRYKETRRSHPLARHGRIERGIAEERERIAFLKEEADWVVDTGRMPTKELRQELEKYFSSREQSRLFITVLSFGFKYGIPVDADLMFDVRFLPNPYYIAELRSHTGEEQAVRDYVMQGGIGEEFLGKLTPLLDFLMPKYEEEGKSQLVIAIGCTGGRHRSVAIASQIFRRLAAEGKYAVRLEHRDIQKD